MLRFHHRVVISLLKGFNLVVLWVTAFISVYAQYITDPIKIFESWLDAQFQIYHLAVIFAAAWVIHTLYNTVLGLYPRSLPLLNAKIAVRHVEGAFLGSAICCAVLSFVWRVPGLRIGANWTIAWNYIGATLLAGIFSTFIILLARWLVWLVFEQWLANPMNRHRIVMVGMTQSTIDYVRHHIHLWDHVIGVFDDDNMPPADLPLTYLENLRELPDYIRTHPVDEIMIFLSLSTHYDVVTKIVSTCLDMGVNVSFPVGLFSEFEAPANEGAAPRQVRDDQLARTIVEWHFSREWTLPYMFKCGFDRIAAAFLLLIFSPLLIVVAILIKRSSKGPVFFMQNRVGYNRRIFRMYKFRTMVDGADKMLDQVRGLNEVGGAAFKSKKDPRITPLGAWLRRTSIDELPQLINVFKGDMTLVGPRPMSVADFDRFYSDKHRRRFVVRPGITGLWQISGRSDLDYEEWMRLDQIYIDNWSIYKDLIILLKTIPVVITGRGAH